MVKPHILVISGGTSDERAVSLRSGAAVSQALQTAGYQVTDLDYTGEPPQWGDQPIDVIFPVLHGAGGEDGGIQRQLDRLGLPYVGSDVTASELCFNKWAYKHLLETNQVLVPRGELVTAVDFARSALSQQPFVLKPLDGGSSVDTIIVRTAGNFTSQQITDVFSRHDTMLLEELISGQEITIGVLGDKALPVIEIIPPANAEFDYTNKYNGQTQELCPPEHISATTQAAAQTLALQIHQLCHCRDFSRTDMIVTDSGELYTLETNTIPGMTNQSLLPKAAATAGLDFPALTTRLVQLALAH